MRLGRDSYTYAHLLLVGGVVFGALGMALLIDGHDDIVGGRAALYGGVAVYLGGTVVFRLRSNRTLEPLRLAGVVALVVLIPIGGLVDPLAQVAICAAALVAITAADSRWGPSRRDGEAG